MDNSADIVIDIETTGFHAGCCILAIGAVTTDFRHEFYQTIWHSPQKTLYGLEDHPSTMKWWSEQAPEVRDEAFSGTKGLQIVLGEFNDWVKSIPAKQKFFWGNGADFDQPILQVAYSKAGMKSPFGFNNRCYRTLKNLYKDLKATDFEGQKHHALWDAKHEAKHLSALLRRHFSSLNSQD